MTTEKPRRSEPARAQPSHGLRDELKTRATILRKELGHADPERAAAAARRLQRLAAYEARAVGEILAARDAVTHGDALAVIAGELTYPSWEELGDDLGARRPDARAALADLLGRRLCPTGGGGYLNEWFRSYPDAVAAHRTRGGYLLPYLRQFLVCQAGLVEHLGLAADDPDWERIGRYWARPRDLTAWRRLNARWWTITHPA